jgi:ABC-2 type transport system ATP-binding protein
LSDSPGAILETHELSKRYGSLLALDRCSMQVQRGEVFGLLGPNGAGKSTLLRTLLGFLKPTSGWGKILKFDCEKQSIAVRQVTSYLPGDARLFRQMRGRDCLAFFHSMRPEVPKQRYLELAERLELNLDRRVVFMSTGMRQKLAIVAVMSAQTPLIILDEPTANLDPTVRGEVLQLVREAKKAGQTVIFSSHVLSEIEEVCDEVVLLRKGTLAKRLRLIDLQQSHRLFAKTSESVVVPSTLVEQVKLVRQDAGAVVIDLYGDLQPLLRWVSEQLWTQVRIEAHGLDSVYQQVHPPMSAQSAAALDNTKS